LSDATAIDIPQRLLSRNRSGQLRRDTLVESFEAEKGLLISIDWSMSLSCSLASNNIHIGDDFHYRVASTDIATNGMCGKLVDHFRYLCRWQPLL